MAKIKVGIKGRNFTLNGKPTKLRMRTSFKWLGYLWNHDLRKAEKWLERVKRQGFHGIRILGESHWWDGHPFFGLYPRFTPWNLNQNPGSSFRMKEWHMKMVEQAVGLLKKHDLIAEYTVIATLKGGDSNDPRPRDKIVGWNSHALRVTAEFFRSIGATNILPETINEFRAHAVSIPDAELGAEARRWKTRDWPGSPIGISEGAWDFHYPVGGSPEEYTHINIHSPRRGDWDKVAGEIKVLLIEHRIPVYLNENIHYMTREQWDTWVPLVPKWASMSTVNAKRLQKQWNDALNAGASYCFHDMNGMATDPDAPESTAEKLFRRQFGEPDVPRPPGPPYPPPPPEPPTPSKKWWEKVWSWIKQRLGV